MFRNLLWRATLAFVLHCTPAVADRLTSEIEAHTGPQAAIAQTVDYAVRHQG